MLGLVFSKESLVITDKFLFIQDTLWLHNFLPDQAAGPCLSLWQRLVGRVAFLWQVWDAVDLRPWENVKEQSMLSSSKHVDHVKKTHPCGFFLLGTNQLHVVPLSF